MWSGVIHACGCMTTIPARRDTREIEDQISIDLLHCRRDEALLHVVSPYCACSSDGFTEVYVDQ